MYFIINIYRSVSVKGPYADINQAGIALAQLQELDDDGWIIVKEVD